MWAHTGVRNCGFSKKEVTCVESNCCPKPGIGPAGSLLSPVALNASLLICKFPNSKISLKWSSTLDFKYVELTCCWLFDKRISLLDNSFREGQVTKFCTSVKSCEAAHKHKKMSVRLKTEALTLRSLRNNDLMTEVQSCFSDCTKYNAYVQWQGHLWSQGTYTWGGELRHTQMAMIKVGSATKGKKKSYRNLEKDYFWLGKAGQTQKRETFKSGLGGWQDISRWNWRVAVLVFYSCLVNYHILSYLQHHWLICSQFPWVRNWLAGSFAWDLIGRNQGVS